MLSKIHWIIRRADADDITPLSIMLTMETRTLEERLNHAAKFAEASAFLVAAESSHHAIVGTGYLRSWMRSAEISDVFVNPAYRRQGIASALMQALIDCARAYKYRTVQLTCDTTNTPALTLYHKLGFEALRVLSLPDRTAWVMSLAL